MLPLFSVIIISLGITASFLQLFLSVWSRATPLDRVVALELLLLGYHSFVRGLAIGCHGFVRRLAIGYHCFVRRLAIGCLCFVRRRAIGVNTIVCVVEYIVVV